jgi:DHA2 family multidrug resistance protein
VGLAIISTVLSNRQDVHYERLREHLDWGNPTAVDQLNSMTSNLNAAGLDGATGAIRQMVNLVTQQAVVMSFSDVFLILTVLFGLMVLGVAMIEKPSPQITGRSGGGH